MRKIKNGDDIKQLKEVIFFKDVMSFLSTSRKKIVIVKINGEIIEKELFHGIYDEAFNYFISTIYDNEEEEYYMELIEEKYSEEYNFFFDKYEKNTHRKIR